MHRIDYVRVSKSFFFSSENYTVNSTDPHIYKKKQNKTKQNKAKQKKKKTKH